VRVGEASDLNIAPSFPSQQAQSVLDESSVNCTRSKINTVCQSSASGTFVKILHGYLACRSVHVTTLHGTCVCDLAKARGGKRRDKRPIVTGSVAVCRESCCTVLPMPNIPCCPACSDVSTGPHSHTSDRTSHSPAAPGHRVHDWQARSGSRAGLLLP
jgi:hypothetical protein